MITVPQSFVDSTVNREGQNGREWIAALPALVNDLCRQWHLVIDGQPLHGYYGLVVPVDRENEPCMLKVSWIDEITRYEARALSIWDGEGAVKLFDAQPGAGALLLERLDLQKTLDDIDVGGAVAVAGGLLRQLAVPDPGSLPAQYSLTGDLSDSLPERWLNNGRPMPRRYMETARDLAAQLGPGADKLVVNYDIHYGDVRAAKRQPWLILDPKVVIGDPEFGVAQLLWCRLEDMEAGAGIEYYFDLLVETAELDRDLARAWTLVRCVDYWLWGLRIGFTEDPARCQFITNWLFQEDF